MSDYKTPETFDELIGLIGAVKGLQKGDKLMFEIDNLYSMQEWALEQQPVKVGDRVVLDTVIDFDNAYGWKAYKEALAFGAVGVVERVSWNGYHKYWAAGFRPDELWSISTFGGGPQRYDYPESKVFTMNVEHLKKI
jgi:hypothetical protein